MKYSSPREIMKAMNDGEITRHDLAPKTFETVKAELFSLFNRITETSTEKEEEEWRKTYYELISSLSQLPEDTWDKALDEVGKIWDKVGEKLEPYFEK